jgi:surface antigen Omp85-like protein/WD40 repeat protein
MPARPFRPLGLGALLLGALAFGAPPLSAQYFGRNKVQYEAFKFSVLKAGHFDVYFYPAEQEAAQAVGRMAERWYARYSRLLGHQLRGRQPIIIYASHPDFEQTNAISGALGEGTGGVTEVLKRRVVLPLASSLAQTDHVLGHELVHAFQYDITGQGFGVNFRLPGAARLPLWFIEGMAEYLSIGPVDPNTAMWLRDAAGHHRIPTIRKLYDDAHYFPYRFGQAFWSFIAGRYGDAMVGEILRRAGHAGSAELALEQVTGLKTDSLSKLWRSEIEASYDPLSRVTSPPRTYGRLLVGGDKRPGLNVAPALSPDGNQMVFFSARDLFSIDLFLADPRTGRVKRRITRTALDPHYQSLEFIASAGAWDAGGLRIALGAVANGKALLSILDAASGRVEREIPLPGIGEVFNPTWSPDGRYVAFSALAGGFTDLFRYDLTDKSLERLTNDAYADFEPAWSPDGRMIAFVTDRFSTKLDKLEYGNYELALMDVRTGAIQRLAAFPDAKNINPQWAPDGRSLYFVSDHNGISNVYRLEIAGGRLFQITNLYTGTSGITDLSPALSVAQGTGRLVFGVYEASGYNLYAFDSAGGGAPAGGPVGPPLAVVSPAVLPPQDRISAELRTALQDPTTGLPPDSSYTMQPYRSRMTLDYVSQPSIAVGADRFGTYVGGGIAMFFSDMLGNHNLVAAAQINGGFKDASAFLGYENDAHRWNWGLAAQQIPYYSGGYGITTGTVQGEPAYVEQITLFRQTNREFGLQAAYPLSTAARVEFSAGIDNISFDTQIETQAIDQVYGVLLYDSLTTGPAFSDINLATATAAFVYDNSIFGATSPVLGQRFRIEVSPAGGTLSWVTLLADYRRYVMPVRPFTLAARLMHFGRYGSGAEDSRLTPLYLGYASLIRGYDIGSFGTNECLAGGSACPAFDRLLGSRLFVGNLELRFPLLGVLGIGNGYYGAFPIEAALFADGGLAYCTGNAANFCTGDNTAVYSTGAALRVNLFGYAVGEIDFVKPWQRPTKGWYLELSLTPGF